jgi:hypothetical protein
VSILSWLRVQWDRAAAAAAVLLGLLCLLLGWIGTSDSLYLAQQVPYLVSGGLLGIFLLGVGAVLWLSADLRDEWRELRALRDLLTEDRLAQRQGGPVATPEPAAGQAATTRQTNLSKRGPRRGAALATRRSAADAGDL